MFRFFSNVFTPKHIAFASCFYLNYHLKVYNKSQNTQFNSKLRQKIEQKYHSKRGLCLQVTEQFKNDVVIFAGNSNKELAQQITSLLGIKLGNATVDRFNDGQVNIQIKQNVRSKDVYIIQSTSKPVNQNLMELLLLIATMRRSSARRITVVIPYYGYARQDRKHAPRVPISAADVARLLQTVGVDKCVLVDVHSGQCQGFFGPRVQVDNLQANMVALNYFLQRHTFPLNNIVVISPDAGGVARAKKFQELLNSVGAKDSTLAMIIKQRMGAGKIASMQLVGSVEGKNAIIIDDMIDTAGTLCNATKTLKQKGALSVTAFATHGVFSGNAYQNIKNSVLDQVIVTNSIRGDDKQEQLTGNKVKRLSLAPILAESIFRIQMKQSVSELFTVPQNK